MSAASRWFLVDALPFFAYQEHGVDYVVALLKGYKDKPPAGFTLPAGGNYNEYFPGHSIAMPPPLTDGRVEYTDGSPATVDQYSKDVAAFMMWAAEPHLEARKRIGFQVMIFLLVFAGADVLHQEEGVGATCTSTREPRENVIPAERESRDLSGRSALRCDNVIPDRAFRASGMTASRLP